MRTGFACSSSARGRQTPSRAAGLRPRVGIGRLRRLVGMGAAGLALLAPSALPASAGTGRGPASGAVRANTPTELDTQNEASGERVVQSPGAPSRAPEAPAADAALPAGTSRGQAPPPPVRDPIEAEPIRRDGQARATPSGGSSSSALGTAVQAPVPAGPARKTTTTGLLWRSISGLLVVCGLLLAGIWVLKRLVPSAQRGGTSEALSVLGRAYIGPKASLFLVRVGRRILVVGSTPSGLARVGEIDDPEEVEQVAARCQRSRANSITGSFRNFLSHGLARHRVTEEERLAHGDDGVPLSLSGRPAGTGRAEGEAGASPRRGEGEQGGVSTPGGGCATYAAADAAAEVGVMKQELDLIIDRVRSWRNGQHGGQPPSGR